MVAVSYEGGSYGVGVMPKCPVLPVSAEM
jgi:hypothetical protein